MRDQGPARGQASVAVSKSRATSQLLKQERISRVSFQGNGACLAGQDTVLTARDRKVDIQECASWGVKR